MILSGNSGNCLLQVQQQWHTSMPCAAIATQPCHMQLENLVAHNDKPAQKPFALDMRDAWNNHQGPMFCMQSSRGRVIGNACLAGTERQCIAMSKQRLCSGEQGDQNVQGCLLGRWPLARQGLPRCVGGSLRPGRRCWEPRMLHLSQPQAQPWQPQAWPRLRPACSDALPHPAPTIAHFLSHLERQCNVLAKFKPLMLHLSQPQAQDGSRKTGVNSQQPAQKLRHILQVSWPTFFQLLSVNVTVQCPCNDALKPASGPAMAAARRASAATSLRRRSATSRSPWPGRFQLSKATVIKEYLRLSSRWLHALSRLPREGPQQASVCCNALQHPASIMADYPLFSRSQCDLLARISGCLHGDFAEAAVRQASLASACTNPL